MVICWPQGGHSRTLAYPLLKTTSSPSGLRGLLLLPLLVLGNAASAGVGPSGNQWWPAQGHLYFLKQHFSGHKNDGSCPTFNIAWAKIPQTDVAGIPRGKPAPQPPPMAPQSSALTWDLHVQTVPILTSSTLRLPALKDTGKWRLKTYPREGAGTNVLRSHQRGDLGEHPGEQASWEPRGKEGCPDNSSLSMQWATREKRA